jgi:hypothetical protein
MTMLPRGLLRRNRVDTGRANRSPLPSHAQAAAERGTQDPSGEEWLAFACQGLEDVADQAKEAVTFETSKAHLSDEAGVWGRVGTKGAAGVGCVIADSAP